MSDMIEYTTATRMAAVYKQSVARVRSLIVELGDECDKLKRSFDCDSGYSFSVDVYFESHQHSANADTAMEISGAMKRAAWRALIAKLGIRKVMSSKRQKELDDALSGQHRSRYGEPAPEALPEIDEDTIYDVLAGMVQSAEEFMEEAVREEYDFFKPSKSHAPYKRNSEFRLQAKIIRPWMVDPEYGRTGKFRVKYDQTRHVTALDNIFHRLDGKGVPPGYQGPLCDAINTSPDGTFRTEYFAGTCHKNGNIHLTFLRQDLLDKFNEIAGRNRLPEPERAA